MTSLEIPPQYFQSMMSWTQAQYVFRSYLANPFWNPLASFVDNCVRAVWMRLLKLRARGQRNIARKLCSNYFHRLYLNPSSFHTSHQHLALAPGHIMYFWEKLNSDCLTPFPSHMQHTCHAPSDTASAEFFCRSSSGLRKRSCSCQKVSTLLNKTLMGSLGTVASISSKSV